MRREEYLKKSTEYILNLHNKVKMFNSLNYYDINISSENFFARLLGLVYGWTLENINHEENNTAAIDLYDQDKRIAVQVTSDDTANKIHTTIDTFIKKNLQNNYDRLIFMVITEGKNYRATFDTKGKFAFDKNSDIITCKKLINDISALDTERIAEIYNYLSFEFDCLVNNDSVWTIESAVQYMSDNTNGVLSLDYFEIDDNDFVNSFTKALNAEQNSIYVKGNSREETLYCVLNLIKKIDVKKTVYIIKNKDTWNRFGNHIQNTILIPFFQDKEIASIKGNINIFIYGIENPTVKSCILLRRRKISTLEEKLKNYKDGGHNLIIKTHGLFPFIKTHLFDGQTEELLYANHASKAVITGLLIGQWTETDGDKSIIEEVSGMTYNEFTEEIVKYINMESPLFIKIDDWNGNTYKVSDMAFFWCKYYSEITDENKQDFYKIAEKVISNKDPLFDLAFEEHVYGIIRANKSTYSNTIKKGILQSLIFLAINENQPCVDRCIQNVLSNVSDLNMWGYIAQFAEQICEASPSVFIEKIEKSKDNDDFIDLFKSDGDFLTSRHYYTHILWAMEQLLRLREYAPRVVRLLMHLTTKIQKCAISNSPSEVLSVIFYPCLNLYSLSFEEKIRLAEVGVKKHEPMWGIIYNILKSLNNAIMVSRPTFNYRISEDVTEVTNEQFYKVNIEYLRILRENSGNDVTKWIKLIGLFANVSDDILIELIQQLEKVLEQLGDKDKEIIKTKLRKEIYRHRFYSHSHWAMSEENICKIENVCKNIQFENPAYDFVYLIDNGRGIPLYNPKPIDNDDRDENEKLEEKVLREEFTRIKNEGVDMCDVIELGKTDKYSRFGSYIAQYYSKDVFDEHLYKKMLQVSDIKRIIHDYVAHTCKLGNCNFDKALNLSAMYDGSNDLYVSILELHEINQEYLDFICTQNTDIQKKYFSNLRFVSEKKPDWSSVFMKKCIEYNCAYSLIDYLYRTKTEYTADELIELLYEISKMPTLGEHGRHETFLLEKVVEYIHLMIKNDFDKYEKMCMLEMRLYNLISWEQMLCTQHLFKTDASLYAELVGIIFKKDSETKTDDSNNEANQKKRKYWLNFHHNAKFCPGEIDGKIDAKILNKWILDLEKLLSNQEQDSLFSHLIGSLFAYSPIGDDGYSPHESIRNVIEERMDDSLKRAYYITVINKRGMHTVDAGEGEKKLALEYKKNADGIRIEYPKTAEIYDMISKNYYTEADIERKRAENGRY